MENIMIKISVNEKLIMSSLEHNRTTSDFLALLPLKVKMIDFKSTEKIAMLNKVLSIRSAPAGYIPRMGDIAYDEQWGSLVIFYKDHSYSNGLVFLGRITSGIEMVPRIHKDEVTFEILDTTAAIAI